MNKIQKLFAYFILPLAIIGLAYACVHSIQKPVNFKKQQAAREQVAIQRLKDIRSLQVAFKSAYGRYSPTVDSLAWFYNNGKLDVIMQIGSQDDSLAVAHTAAVYKKNPKITAAELMKLYEQGESLVFKIGNKIDVKDTICRRADFCVDSLAFIPYSGGEKVELESAIKVVSGVNVPLFEASMPYKKLLKGMDHQLIVNLVAEREDTDRYPGLKVGSITAPNNNAGNWE